MNSNFTEGRIVPKLVRFVFPILFAMLVQSLYGAVDLLIVGQFSDAANVSAVAVGSQLMHSLTFVITDLAAGTAILLGQFIGQKNTQRCGETVGATLFFFGILGVVISLVMQPLAGHGDECTGGSVGADRRLYPHLLRRHIIYCCL